MSFKQWQDYRTTWTTARNGARVAKGAVLGVNIGDSIEAVAKAYSKGFPALRSALAKLLANVKKYRAGIAKKSAALDGWIQKNLEKDALALDAECIETMKVYPATAALVQKAEEILRTVPSNSALAEIGREAEKQKVEWISLAKPGLDRAATAATAFAAATQAVMASLPKIKVEIQGKEIPKDVLKTVAVRLKEVHDLLVQISQCKTWQAYVAIMVASAGTFPASRDPFPFSNTIRRIAKVQGIE